MFRGLVVFASGQRIFRPISKTYQILEKTSVHTPSGLPHNPRQFLPAGTPIMTVIACGRNRRLGGGLTWPFSGEAWLLPHGGPGSGLCSVERGRARSAERRLHLAAASFRRACGGTRRVDESGAGLKSERTPAGRENRAIVYFSEARHCAPLPDFLPPRQGAFFDKGQGGFPRRGNGEACLVPLRGGGIFMVWQSWSKVAREPRRAPSDRQASVRPFHRNHRPSSGWGCGR
jgi:hypothetical protein